MRSSDIRELYEAAYRRLVVQLYAVTGDLAEALPDGRLACIGGTDTRTRLLTSDDHGRTWHQVPGAPALTTLQRAGDRLIGQTSDGQGMAVSDDGGRDWTVHRLSMPG